MIRIHFSIKRSPGKEKGTEKISGLNIRFDHASKPSKGVIRHRNLLKEKVRVKNGQLVITKDGLGTIKEYMVQKDPDGRIISQHHLNVHVRNLKSNNRVYKLNELSVVDIIDDNTGIKYPVAESDYLLCLMNDAPVEFTITRQGRAMLAPKSRKQFASCKIFARKQNGIKMFNELIEKGIWNPIKK